MTVYLVGAGPGSADLLTLRAAELLKDAEVVVYDRLVDSSVLALVNPAAELIDVGKRPGRSSSQAMINELLVVLGSAHQHVVRLKGGDPFVFGRGGEEVESLRAARIGVEVVPGVTSAFGAPSVAGIPVTHRGLSHGVTVVTGHASDGSGVNFRALANADITLVVLMGVEHRSEIAEELIQGGLSPGTPVAAIEAAWTEQQSVVRGSLSELGSLEVHPPAVLVIGPVAALSLSELAATINAAG